MAVLVLVEGKAKADCVRELQGLMKKHFPGTRAYDGCQGTTGYLNVDDGCTVVFAEHWNTKEAHQRYMAWRMETGIRAQFASMLEGPPTVRYFETVDA